MISHLRRAWRRWWASTTPRDAEAVFGTYETAYRASQARCEP